MNDQFNEQKELLTSLKHEISLLQQQIDYLIRNEKALGLLDLDVMMNRTHTIYDRLCSIHVGTPTRDDEDLDIDPKMFSALFGLDENNETAEEEPQEDQENEEPETVETPLETEAPITTDIENPSEEEAAAPVEVETTEYDWEETKETHIEETSETETTDQPKEEKAPETTEEDYGFIFKLEPEE